MKKMLTLAFTFMLTISLMNANPPENLVEKSKRKNAADFSLRSLDGKQVSLSQFKGQVVYIDFWASWCGPCRAEMPNSKKLKENEIAKQVTFLYISIDKDETKWKNSISSLKIDGINLISNNMSEGGIGQNYDTGYIPHYVLVDKEGKIAAFEAKRPGDRSLINDLETLLKE